MNGRRWSIQPTRKLTSGELNGVSCTSRTACTAVGSVSPGGGSDLPLVERWNGRRWSIQRTPKPAGSDGALYGVSCTSKAACTAVGNFGRPSGTSMVERWNGFRWSIQHTPLDASRILAVSCWSKTACTSVGESGSPRATCGELIEGWNGRRWSIEPHPYSGGCSLSGGELDGVSCTSKTACTAVGSYDIGDCTDEGDYYVPLMGRWNGRRWSIQRTNNLSCGTVGGGAGLYGVSCPSKTACTAVGYDSTRGRFSPPLAERWNGTRWSIQPTPKLSYGQLHGVSCTSTTICTAVGYFDNTNYDEVPLVERYHGH